MKLHKLRVTIKSIGNYVINKFQSDDYPYYVLLPDLSETKYSNISRRFRRRLQK